MLEGVKEMLLDEPEHIVNLLNEYDFHKIKLTTKEIRCAYEPDGNPTGICIRLIDNPYLYVKDYERNISCDLIDYFVKERNGSFRTVLQSIKAELGIANIELAKPKVLFGGLWDRIKYEENDEIQPTIISEDVLLQYEKHPNLRFFRDNISYDTQRKYEIGYDISTQRITIPIRSPLGGLMGVKGRCNYIPSEFEPKYLYLTESCSMSATLYGYWTNYDYILKSGICFLLEAEKSVMQLDTMGCYLGLGLGSNSVSKTQASLIAKLQPKCVVFLLDNSLPLENTKKNIDILKEAMPMSGCSFKFFNWTKCNFLEEKDSPTDKGREIFEKILKQCISDESEISHMARSNNIIDAAIAARYFVENHGESRK